MARSSAAGSFTIKTILQKIIINKGYSMNCEQGSTNLMAINNFTNISKGSIIMRHETIKDHQSTSNGGRASPAGFLYPRSLGRDSDCSLDLDFKRLAINCGGQALWAESANGSCLDSRCQYPRGGLSGGSSSIGEIPSGNPRGGPKVGNGLGEKPPGIGNPSLPLGWNFGYGISEEVLGDLDPA
jgi:hypothetical protein